MRSWYVVQTHTNAEAKALGHLARQGFAAYLPRCTKHRRHAGRVELVKRPLFPRYLFVCIDLLERGWRPIVSTIGVSQMVQFGDRPAPVPEGVVEEIRRREAEGSFSPQAALRGLKPDQELRVTSGAFADLVGRFVALTDSERVLLLLEMLGRSVRLELPMDAVAPV
jgi:transcriptional antiterminator RfaH